MELPDAKKPYDPLNSVTAAVYNVKSQLSASVTVQLENVQRMHPSLPQFTGFQTEWDEAALRLIDEKQRQRRRRRHVIVALCVTSILFLIVGVALLIWNFSAH